MRILILIPVALDSNRGNRITGSRWQQLLGDSGHKVDLADRLPSSLAGIDCVIALHALRSYEAIQQLRQIDPFDRPKLIVCMTGTDLHRDFEPLPALRVDPGLKESSDKIQQVWQATDRIVLIEPEGQARIPDRFQHKCRVIFQSAVPVACPATPPADQFRISVIGHLRPIKDPFRTAAALRLLPATSRAHVVHVGEALTIEMKQQAEQEMANNPRYCWVGSVSHQQALNELTASQLMVLSSISEGGPSVISEAAVNGVPVIASRIDATVGMLGADYAGLFTVGDTQELADLLWRAESDRKFLNQLSNSIDRIARQFSTERERRALHDLVTF